MPTIDLQGDPFDVERVRAVQYFPQDQGMREGYLTRQRCLRLATAASDEVNIPTELLTKLLDSCSHTEINERATQAVREGMVAGHLLVFVYVMDIAAYSTPFRPLIPR